MKVITRLSKLGSPDANPTPNPPRSHGGLATRHSDTLDLGVWRRGVALPLPVSRFNSDPQKNSQIADATHKRPALTFDMTKRIRQARSRLKNRETRRIEAELGQVSLSPRPLMPTSAPSASSSSLPHRSITTLTPFRSSGCPLSLIFDRAHLPPPSLAFRPVAQRRVRSLGGEASQVVVILHFP